MFARLEAPLVRFVFCEPRAGQGALPDECTRTGASLVGQANALKEIYVSLCKWVR